MTKDELQIKAKSLKVMIETLINAFNDETGYVPIIEINNTIIPGYGDCSSKKYTQVVVKIEL